MTAWLDYFDGQLAVIGYRYELRHAEAMEREALRREFADVIPAGRVACSEPGPSTSANACAQDDRMLRVMRAMHKLGEQMAWALDFSYDAQEWPADGTSMQEKASAQWRAFTERVFEI